MSAPTRQHVASTPIAVPTTEEGPRVETTAGPVRGLWRKIVSAPDRQGPAPLFTRSAAFYGIPYAEAPFGERRFMAPVRRAGWTQERTALTPSATPQRGSIFDDPAIPEPSVPGEDFLTVNVFTPAPGDEGARLPVLVWIHGGGWSSGSHNSPWYDGAAFNRDGVVTVSVAYRLGYDGYGWVPGSDAPYNRAVLDQVMALEWVRDNIARFGGDPEQVTVAGQSAGGGNSMVLLAVPRAKGLFHRIISQSGALPKRSASTTQEMSRTLAQVLGVELSLEGMRSATYDEVFEASRKVTAPDGAGLAGLADPVEALRGVLGQSGSDIPFLPTVDGEVIALGEVEALRSGWGAKVPVLAGSTMHDFAFAGLGMAEAMKDKDLREVLVAGGLSEEIAQRVIEAHPEHAGTPHMVVGDLISDATFHKVIAEWFLARQEAAAGEGTTSAGSYAYEFAYCAGPLHMATHCMDVPFTFDCLADPYCEHTLGGGAPRELADAMHGVWVSFIREGQPGWEPWTERSVGRRFGDNRAGEMSLQEDRVLFDTDRDLVAASR
ncbi:MAG: carboxylesterase family protein [Actinomyces urogenitalis]|uniref:carboxylesterase/lipase family protein n=1 Tax=Actinomyces urogenitalis TaxID=103621 RepID=UPI002A7EE2F3|nr:carboxylesterase family protein [Actinomyces urogenitalis]MDY3677601.1 carboxylesterase family protein [Actinomyces urogenitalis]